MSYRNLLRTLIVILLIHLPGTGFAVTFVDTDANAKLADGRSWQTAFPLLQDALSCVNSGVCDRELWVAAGAYRPDEGNGKINDDPKATFRLQEGTKLYGGFQGTDGKGGGALETQREERRAKINKTVLSGDLEYNDVDGNQDGIILNTNHIVGVNSEHVVTLDTTNLGTITNATILDGLYITAGNNVADNSKGAGLFCLGSETKPCSPKLRQIVFRGNRATKGGALYSEYSIADWERLEFRGNEAVSYATDTGVTLGGHGGAFYINYGEVNIANLACFFNKAVLGGCAYNLDTTINIIGASVVKNFVTGSGGGAYNDNSHVLLKNTGFFGNVANSGGAVANRIGTASYGLANIINSVFSGNIAVEYYGGAIYNYGDSLSYKLSVYIRNSSFSNNRSVFGLGGSIYTDWFDSYVEMDVVNSIFWDGSDSVGANEIYTDNGEITVAFSDIQGGVANITQVAGTLTDLGGIVDSDPFFVDPDGVDNAIGTQDDQLAIQSSPPGGIVSPVIDSGNNNALFSDTDYLGNPRVSDGDGDGVEEIDMGAYELN